MNFDIAFSNFEKIIELTNSEKEIFESLVDTFQINRRSHLLREGEYCNYEYFVMEGCLRSYYLDYEGKEHSTMFAIEGWWTGNLKSFVRSTPSDFFIEALENSVLLRFDKQKMEELYLKIPKFERYFRILLQNRLLVTQDRVSHHLSTSASERYLDFVKKYPTIEQRVPLKHIASYIGVTPTYLSRLRKNRVNV